jgi:hypothetical protein
MQNKNKKELTELKGKVKKKDTIFSKYVKDRIFRQNKNFFMIIVGGVGTGKSYSALRLAEQLDESFTIERCCFKALPFMRKIKEFQDLVERENISIKGKAVLWDELGVEHNAREFMTISNRVINFFFQTSRALNLIVIMTVPYLSYVDSATRKLAHCIAETQGINHRKKQATLKIKFLQVAPFTGKEYPKYLRYTKNNRHFKIERIKVSMPSPELAEPYEIEKKKYLSELYTDGINRIERAEQKQKRQNTRGLKEGSMQFDIWTIATTIKWKTQEDIRQELSKKYERDVDKGQLNKNIGSMRKNGYDINDFKGN